VAIGPMFPLIKPPRRYRTSSGKRSSRFTRSTGLPIKSVACSPQRIEPVAASPRRHNRCRNQPRVAVDGRTKDENARCTQTDEEIGGLCHGRPRSRGVRSDSSCENLTRPPVTRHLNVPARLLLRHREWRIRVDQNLNTSIGVRVGSLYPGRESSPRIVQLETCPPDTCGPRSCAFTKTCCCAESPVLSGRSHDYGQTELLALQKLSLPASRLFLVF